jgi:hypothetical protein
MKEYVIHVTKTGYPGLDGAWAVGFSVDKTDPSNKEVTFCMLRNELWFEPFSGCSVKNPHDTPDQKGYDPRKGEQTAFKRAVEQATNFMGDDESKNVMSRFRGALWIAQGRPGYKKAAVSPIYGILQEMVSQLSNEYEGE